MVIIFTQPNIATKFAQ